MEYAQRRSLIAAPVTTCPILQPLGRLVYSDGSNSTAVASGSWLQTATMKQPTYAPGRHPPFKAKQKSSERAIQHERWVHLQSYIRCSYPEYSNTIVMINCTMYLGMLKQNTCTENIPAMGSPSKMCSTGTNTSSAYYLTSNRVGKR